MLSALRTKCAPTADDLRLVVRDMLEQMSAGLQPGGTSRLKMLSSFFERLPSGSEAGTYYAVDLGGTNFRVVRVKLGGGRVQENEATEVRIPPDLMRGTCQQLFSFIADTVAAFVQGDAGGGKALLGFTFSFPCEQTAVNAGNLITWTKGFACVDGPGLDVVELLNKEFQARGLAIEVAALVNDTVGTLAAAKFADTDAVIGVILGTGTNACYIEGACAGTKVASSSGQMVINIEWGNFAAASLPVLEADRKIDRESVNPGEQIFEKLLSGMYLGRIAKEVLLELDAAERFLEPTSRDALAAADFSTSTLSAIDMDSSEGLAAARGLVGGLLGREPSAGELSTVKEVCHLVALRSARLAAAGVFAVLSKMGLPSTTSRSVVAIDGGLYEHYAAYAASMAAALRELAGEAARVELTLAKDGSGLGAALLAAAAVGSSGSA